MEPDEQIKLDTKNALSYVSRSLNRIADIMVKTFKNNMNREGIRVRTGNLRGSIESQINNENEIIISSDVDYATYVDEGTSKMRGRPFFVETPEMEQEIEKIIDEEITKDFK